MDTPDIPREAGLFASTRWSLVLSAQEGSSTALGSLLEAYQEPIVRWLKANRTIAYIAKLGGPALEERDLVQGCFHRLLARDFLREINQKHGKFRTFLLAAMRNHISDVISNLKASKRNQGQAPTSLDRESDEGIPVHSPQDASLGPDQEYDKAWALAILRKAFSNLRSTHKEPAFFDALIPHLFRDLDQETLAEIGRRFRKSEGNVRVQLHRTRQTLRRIICDLVLETVTNPADLASEIHYFKSLFAQMESPYTIS